LKYFKDIRLAAACSSSGWYKYEEQFRLRMAANPNASWDQVNLEFWLFYVSSSITKPHVDSFKSNRANLNILTNHTKQNFVTIST
jgi:hypothetical protein